VTQILIATSNTHKICELRQMGQRLEIRFISPAELGIHIEVEEGVTSFRENASIKAIAYSTKYPGLVLADDSGFLVCALGGRPGVLSSRFEGLKSDDQRCQRVLTLLENNHSGNRKAEFRCAMAIARHEELLFSCEGVCEGTVSHEPRGENGFGYDPIFLPDGMKESFAQLTFVDKNGISHRAKAFNLVADWIDKYEPNAVGG